MNELFKPTQSELNKKKIIVSYASKGREDYNKGQERLKESILKNWDGDYWLHSMERDGQLPDSKLFKNYTHEQIPYFFKFSMIQIARENGYEEIYWLDSSLILERNITGLANPVMAFDNLGHPLEKYISDMATNNLMCANYLKEVKQIWGGAIGFNFNSPDVKYIFDEIHTQAMQGSFNEGKSTRNGFVAHRHDQAVMSVIFHDYNIELLPYGYIVTSPHFNPPYEYGENFYISHRSI